MRKGREEKLGVDVGQGVRVRPETLPAILIQPTIPGLPPSQVWGTWGAAEDHTPPFPEGANGQERKGALPGIAKPLLSLGFLICKMGSDDSPPTRGWE